MWALPILMLLSLTLGTIPDGLATAASVTDDSDPISGQGIQDGPDPLKCLLTRAVGNGNSLMPTDACPENPFRPQITNDPEPFGG